MFIFQQMLIIFNCYITFENKLSSSFFIFKKLFSHNIGNQQTHLLLIFNRFD